MHHRTFASNGDNFRIRYLVSNGHRCAICDGRHNRLGTAPFARCVQSGDQQSLKFQSGMEVALAFELIQEDLR
jgi:hypothetical protein